MRMRVQGRYMQECIIEIHQVFVNKHMVGYFSNRVVIPFMVIQLRPNQINIISFSPNALVFIKTSSAKLLFLLKCLCTSLDFIMYN